tara:strand:+ start:188 stop:1009 length:822 start_codon:yes stop_codon:yes gene_type:complete
MGTTYSVDYDPTYVGPGEGTADTQAGPSAAIWHNCPILQILEDPGKGIIFWDDFLTPPVTPTETAENPAGVSGSYITITSDGAADIQNGGGLGGEVKLNPAASDKHCAMRAGGAIFDLSTGHKPLWFEARVKVGQIANAKGGFFVGLFEGIASTATSPITANGTMANENNVGFQVLEGDGDALVVSHGKAGASGNDVATAAATVAAGTYVKVGFKMANNACEFFANGVLVKTVLASAAKFPEDLPLSPTFAAMGAAANTTGYFMDWWRVVQER